MIPMAASPPTIPSIEMAKARGAVALPGAAIPCGSMPTGAPTGGSNLRPSTHPTLAPSMLTSTQVPCTAVTSTTWRPESLSVVWSTPM